MIDNIMNCFTETVRQQMITSSGVTTEIVQTIWHLIKFTIHETQKGGTIIKTCHFPLCAAAALYSPETIYHTPAFLA